MKDYSIDTHIARDSGVGHGEGDICRVEADTMHGGESSASCVEDTKAPVFRRPHMPDSVLTVKNESAVSTAAAHHDTPLSKKAITNERKCYRGELP